MYNIVSTEVIDLMIMFVVDKMSSVPVFEQIINQTEEYILKGMLKPNEPMPSVRAVASEILSNPNTVQKAYTQMLGMGWLYAVPGKGSFVSEDALAMIRNEYQKRLVDIKRMSSEFCKVGIEKQLIYNAVDEGYKK